MFNYLIPSDVCLYMELFELIPPMIVSKGIYFLFVVHLGGNISFSVFMFLFLFWFLGFFNDRFLDQLHTTTVVPEL